MMKQVQNSNNSIVGKWYCIEFFGDDTPIIIRSEYTLLPSGKGRLIVDNNCERYDEFYFSYEITDGILFAKADEYTAEKGYPFELNNDRLTLYNAGCVQLFTRMK